MVKLEYNKENKEEIHRLMGATAFVHKKKHKGKHHEHLKEVMFIYHPK